MSIIIWAVTDDSANCKLCLILHFCWDKKVTDLCTAAKNQYHQYLCSVYCGLSTAYCYNIIGISDFNEKRSNMTVKILPEIWPASSLWATCQPRDLTSVSVDSKVENVECNVRYQMLITISQCCVVGSSNNRMCFNCLSDFNIGTHSTCFIVVTAATGIYISVSNKH